MDLLKITNPFVLTQEATNVLIDIDLYDNKDFIREILSVMSHREYGVGTDFTCTLTVHLTERGMDMFMKHVRARAEQIGMSQEDVNNALSLRPMTAIEHQYRKSYKVIPELEFITLTDTPEEEGK